MTGRMKKDAVLFLKYKNAFLFITHFFCPKVEYTYQNHNAFKKYENKMKWLLDINAIWKRD